MLSAEAKPKRITQTEALIILHITRKPNSIIVYYSFKKAIICVFKFECGLAFSALSFCLVGETRVDDDVSAWDIECNCDVVR